MGSVDELESLNFDKIDTAVDLKKGCESLLTLGGNEGLLKDYGLEEDKATEYCGKADLRQKIENQLKEPETEYTGNAGKIFKGVVLAGLGVVTYKIVKAIVVRFFQCCGCCIDPEDNVVPIDASGDDNGDDDERTDSSSPEKTGKVLKFFKRHPTQNFGGMEGLSNQTGMILIIAAIVVFLLFIAACCACCCDSEDEYY